MKVLEAIYKQIFDPKSETDHFWGDLVYIDGLATEQYWEGLGIFPPTADIIYFFIDSNGETPSDAQRDFYIELQKNYRSVEKQLSKLVYPIWKDNNSDKRFPKNFRDEFRIASIEIPLAVARPFRWELTFFAKNDKGFIYTCTLEDLIPSFVTRNKF